ncbi:MAG: hypothetical protein OEY87_03185 [Gammaproteobacteria bacterium]|nr:hypothetical protein [Gammaproteobacteria bacterium]MDH5735105.1 hypothetical protein [Gammaproteobacteria bacterium]
MKFATLLAILSLTATFNTAYATQDAGNEDAMAYCDDQAQMAGIDDAEEKKQYIQECVDSFGSTSGDYQQPGQ